MDRLSTKLLSIMMTLSENCSHYMQQSSTSKNKKEIHILVRQLFKCLSAVFQELKVDLE